LQMSEMRADRIVRKLWDSDVVEWDRRWVPIFRSFAQDLVSDAGISGGMTVLDVGTGTGIAALEAAKRVGPNGFVIGIDRSRPMLDLAAKKRSMKFPNIRFLKMSAERLHFSDKRFDVLISNCGISYATFPQVVAEGFRVLRKGGVFALNDWHLKDVPAHRAFSNVLEQYRTTHPSKRLRTQRVALAMLERMGSRYLTLDSQREQLEMVGFRKIGVRERQYRFELRGIQQYLDLRLKRAALRSELSELATDQRKAFLTALRNELRSFLRGERFILNWKVNFIWASK